MMLAAFGMGLWLGHSLAGIAPGQGTVLPLTNGIWFWSVLIATTAWTLVRWNGGPAPVRAPAPDTAP
jgi:DHA1 family bicyclomycin/chloramphenicol resistance-like MFS transporter